MSANANGSSRAAGQLPIMGLMQGAFDRVEQSIDRAAREAGIVREQRADERVLDEAHAAKPWHVTAEYGPAPLVSGADADELTHLVRLMYKEPHAFCLRMLALEKAVLQLQERVSNHSAWIQP